MRGARSPIDHGGALRRPRREAGIRAGRPSRIAAASTVAVTSSLSPRRIRCRNSIEAPRALATLVSNSKQVVHQRRREKLDLQRAHREDDAGGLRQLAMGESAPAQPLRAPALEEPQVGGVIDAAGEVGVFIVDANQQRVGRGMRQGLDSCDGEKGVSAPPVNRAPRRSLARRTANTSTTDYQCPQACSRTCRTRLPRETRPCL